MSLLTYLAASLYRAAEHNYNKFTKGEEAAIEIKRQKFLQREKKNSGERFWVTMLAAVVLLLFDISLWPLLFIIVPIVYKLVKLTQSNPYK